MKTSESTAKLDEALAKAQGEFTNPEKNRTVVVQTKAGGSYSFEYATFDAIIDMARPILAKHGISVSQFPSVTLSGDETIATVATRIAHCGEWMVNEVSGPCEGRDMQKLGSAFTYLERYSYSAMLGIVSEYDDDGAAACGHQSTPTVKAPKPTCPKCGKNTFVYENKPEQGPGWFCWKNEAKGKQGCGHKWTPTDGLQAVVLSQEEINYVGEATSEIASVKTEDELRAVGEIIKGKSDAIRNALRPLYQARLKEFETQSA